MPWPSLSPPTAGTVITVAWESAQVNDPLLWLRLMTGNADPPANDYVVVSQGTGSTAWGKVTANVLGAGAVVGHLGYTPVNRAGDTITGALGVTGNLTSSSSISATGNVSAGQNVTTTTGTIQGAIVSATTQVQAPSASITGNITAGSATITGTLTATSVQPSSISASGNIVSTGGSISAGGNVSATGNITTTSGTVAGSIVQASSSMNVNGQTVWNAAHFAQPTATPTANRVPIADGAGKLDAWVTPTAAAPVPSGLIAFIADGNLPTGWVFETRANGRVIVAAGSAGVTNDQTFGVNGQYGTDWAHGHTVNISHAHGHAGTHTHGASALGVTGHVGTPSATNGLAAPGGTNLPTDTHTHDASAGGGTLDVNGTTDAASAGTSDNAGSTAQATSGVVWVPPAYALNAIRKS